jgi:hypothetical protein
MRQIRYAELIYLGSFGSVEEEWSRDGRERQRGLLVYGRAEWKKSEDVPQISVEAIQREGCGRCLEAILRKTLFLLSGQWQQRS